MLDISRCQRTWCVRDPVTGRTGLAAVLKRTYEFDAAGRIALADHQSDLVLEPEVSGDHRDGCAVLLDDTDMLARKPCTDVVIQGRAYGWGGLHGSAGFAVGSVVQSLRIHGERFVDIARDGGVRFSTPLPFDSVEIGHRSSYGGCDYHALQEMAPPPDPTSKVQRVGVFAYPRNPAGRGYFIDLDRRRAEGASLPLIEDPSDPLTPERFFVESPVRWLDAPASARWGWIHYTWYPRLFRLMGPVLPYASPSRRIREITCEDGVDLHEIRRPRTGTMHVRALQGAAPGLAISRLNGDEHVTLRNLHRTHREVRFDLPGERPLVTIKAPDVKDLTPEATIQTLRIQPELDRFSLTWCSVVPLLGRISQEYLDRVALRVTWTRF